MCRDGLDMLGTRCPKVVVTMPASFGTAPPSPGRFRTAVAGCVQRRKPALGASGFDAVGAFGGAGAFVVVSAARGSQPHRESEDPR